MEAQLFSEPGVRKTGREDPEERSGRERLKRHRMEVAGRVVIPEIWGQEELLKNWVDSKAFDAAFESGRIALARRALMQECKRTNPARIRMSNTC